MGVLGLGWTVVRFEGFLCMVGMVGMIVCSEIDSDSDSDSDSI